MRSRPHILPLKSPQENGEVGLSRDVVAAYDAGELDPNQIVCVGQDIYESGVMPRLPPRYFLLVEHLKRTNLIHTHGRAFH